MYLLLKNKRYLYLLFLFFLRFAIDLILTPYRRKARLLSPVVKQPIDCGVRNLIFVFAVSLNFI